MTRIGVFGEVKEIQLGQGRIRYRESGSGEPLVFLHGIVANGNLWRKVIPRLSEDFRCVVPDLPLGAHEIPMNPEADLTPPGLAALVVDFLAALGLEGATVVGNNTGGAIAQILVAEHPEKVGRLILTPCDCYENFLPPALRYLQWISHLPGSTFLVAQVLRVRPLRRLPITFGWLSKRPVEREVMDAYVRPLTRNRGVRRDFGKVLRGISHKYTQAAAEKFDNFPGPVLLAWATEDRLFPLRYAERLSGAFPEVRLERIDDSYTFISEDRPEELAELISSFATTSNGREEPSSIREDKASRGGR